MHLARQGAPTDVATTSLSRTQMPKACAAVNVAIATAHNSNGVPSCRQVYFDLLHTEEEYASTLKCLVDGYVERLDRETTPLAVREHGAQLALSFRELHNFHAK